MTKEKISIITPCYNEEGNVAACVAEVARVMADELADLDYEHIFCDNASTDGTLDALRQLAAADPHVKVIVNSRNVGPFRSMANGLRSVTGDLVVPMIPADLQDPPSAIPGMVALMTPAVEVVYGIRANRRESILMRAARNSYYLALRSSGGVTPPAHAGEFMLARRDVIDAISEVGGSYPYIRGLVAQTNPRFETYSYEWARRDIGKSKNSIPDLIDQALNGIVTTARTPIRWALFLGLVFAVVGVVIGIANLVIFLVNGSTAAPGIPTLIVATFLFGGVNLFFLGLIGEYILSIHSSVRPEPPMFERERINFE
ncbi:glycosyltransferase family 2 protein [Lacisediminihabitans sp.]|jgi:glycosyltransferase involved in cell wall biosynthesis|uniref:glycosyltransferase family 2 protein n=1 Tax=Lacisediminihabitans sp. TaxID=2787631 RepID=UPI002F95C447